MSLTKITSTDNFVVWILFGVWIYFFGVRIIETTFVITVTVIFCINACQSKLSYSEYFISCYHNTHLNCLPTCNISLTLSCFCISLSFWDLFFSSGFSLKVTMQIGSLVHLTCFWSVSLSCIFWSISNPFFQNIVSSFLLWFVSSWWNFFQ